jgi:hypothetical protein
MDPCREPMPLGWAWLLLACSHAVCFAAAWYMGHYRATKDWRRLVSRALWIEAKLGGLTRGECE